MILHIILNKFVIKSKWICKSVLKPYNIVICL